MAESLQLVPQACANANMPMLLQVIGNPSLALQALAEGFSCLPASSGDQILQYYELTIGVGETVGILLAFYAFFLVASYVALTVLYRQKQ